MVIIEIFSGIGQALAPNVYVFLASRLFLGIAAYGRFLTGNLLSNCFLYLQPKKSII
jgi:hypothetical protein